jgi:hypothetical protein
MAQITVEQLEALLKENMQLKEQLDRIEDKGKVLGGFCGPTQA